MPSTEAEVPDAGRFPAHVGAPGGRPVRRAKDATWPHARLSVVLGVIAVVLSTSLVGASSALAARPSATTLKRPHAAAVRPLKRRKHHHPTPTTTTTTIPPVTVPPLATGQRIGPGATGAEVVAIQTRLIQLGYWIGTPDGYYGDATVQAVYAIQKVADLPRDGIVGASTLAAIDRGALPTPRTTTGYAIEVNLATDVLFMVDNGRVEHVFNCSTGGGYTYVESGVSNVALTPKGIYHTYRAVDGLVTDSLGQLWRPRFFVDGYAIHGDSYVPPEPVSHGCVRVSNEAINWIWASNSDPVGTEVWVYS